MASFGLSFLSLSRSSIAEGLKNSLDRSFLTKFSHTYFVSDFVLDFICCNQDLDPRALKCLQFCEGVLSSSPPPFSLKQANPEYRFFLLSEFQFLNDKSVLSWYNCIPYNYVNATLQLLYVNTIV